jgi:hypothetical protein
MSQHDDALRAGIRPYLEDGEEVRAAVVASPRGSQTAGSGGLGAAGAIGRAWSGRNEDGAAEVGLVLQRSCGVVLTDRRLVTLDLAISAFGKVKAVRGVLSAVPRGVLSAVSVKRMGAVGVLTLEAGPHSFNLEAKPAAAKELAEAYVAG